MSEQHKPGDLQVWWIPQVPCDPFIVPVKTVEEGAKILDVLAKYDLFQYETSIKPDYANAGGLRVYEDDSDGEGNPGFVEWHDDNGDDIDYYLGCGEKNDR